MSILQAAAAKDFPGVDLNELCFVVDFAVNPPSIWLERPTESERTLKGTIIEEIFTKAARRKGSIVMKIKPVCDLSPEKCSSVLRLVYVGDCKAGVMNAGGRGGGKSRPPCRIGHRQGDSVKAEYDVIDELFRRVESVDPDILYAVDYDMLTEVIRAEALKLLHEIGPTSQDLIFV